MAFTVSAVLQVSFCHMGYFVSMDCFVCVCVGLFLILTILLENVFFFLVHVEQSDMSQVTAAIIPWIFLFLALCVYYCCTDEQKLNRCT